MHIEVDRLAHLVAELLQLARVEAGRIELDLRVHDADDLLQDAVDQIQPYAERVGLSVQLDARHQPGARVCADNHRVGQILANLLNNAVKFTPPGGCVQVGACAQDDVVELWTRISNLQASGSSARWHGVGESPGPGRGATFRFTLPGVVMSTST